MPKLEEWCEVRTNAGIFRDWTSVSVRYGHDPSWLRYVTLECAEPMEPGRSGVAKVAERLKPGDRVDVALAGQLVIQGGMIKVRQAAYDGARHAVQVMAVSHANAVKSTSVDFRDGGQYRGYTFEALAKKALGQIGVNLRLVNPGPAAAIPFRNVIVNTGETIGEYVQRLAMQRNIWLTVDVDGTVVGGEADAGVSGGVGLEEGVNILKATSYIEKPDVESIFLLAQAPGSDDLWGRRVSEIGAVANIPSGDPGKIAFLLAEMADTLPEAQARADNEVANLASAVHRDVITHKGWFRPGTSRLWQPRERVTVKSPMLYPFDGGKQDLRVLNVTCSQSNEGGTTTSVELVNEWTFQQRHPDANQPNFGTPAQPVPQS